MDMFKKIKFQSALVGAKVTSKLLKIFSKSAGTSFPGVVAIKVDDNFLTDVGKYCNKKIITVTGTNGKTTTSGLISKILSTNKEKVLHNQHGANMPQGIASALALGVNPAQKSDYFVLETDEAYLTQIYSQMKADYLVVTNLFDDQTDRHGAVNLIADKIKDAIDKNSDLRVVLNADDVMLRNLYTQNILTYGFEKIDFDKSLTVPKVQERPIYCLCGEMLNFKEKFYAHIGHYACPCGYKRPEPMVNARAKIFADKTLLTVKYLSKVYDFELKFSGVYNAYNALASIALALDLGVGVEAIQQAFDDFESSFGRANKLKIGLKNLYVQMIKNPVGATEGIKTVVADNNSSLLIMINDGYSDGRDVSWLWDVEFSLLSNYKGKIYLSGKRAHDVALRLKYLDIDMSKVCVDEDIEGVFGMALSSLEDNQTLYALPCYSAMVELKNILKQKKIV